LHEAQAKTKYQTNKSVWLAQKNMQTKNKLVELRELLPDCNLARPLAGIIFH
jgi:hypothetical protein